MDGLNLSAFEVIGPVMVGPSSSHTAGAVRLGLAALGLLGEPARKAVIGLHGSFAATGRGHATDRALLAGILGYAPDDARLPQSPELAQASGLEFDFVAEDLGESAHPNSARVQLSSGDRALEMTGASLGGGLIEIVQIDGYPTSFRANLNTLVFWHGDERGFLAKVTAVLACAEVNIASLRTSRQRKGDRALTVIETDGTPPEEALRLMEKMPVVATLRHLFPL
jgi:L-serine dehydratase